MTPKKHEVPEEPLASLLADYKKPEDLTGENGLLKQLTTRLIEKALEAELTEHTWVMIATNPFGQAGLSRDSS